MPVTTIISNQKLPVPSRNSRGRVVIKLADGTGIIIPSDLESSDLSDVEVRNRIENHLLDLGNIKDILRLWLLIHRLSAYGYTLAQAADQNGVHNALLAARYHVQEETP